MPHLPGCLQHPVVEAIRQNRPFAREHPVHRSGQPGSDALHPPPQVFLSNALANEPIGLEPVDDGVWSIIYYRTLLGRIDERTGEITGAMV